MIEDRVDRREAAARAMLELFASVGATAFDVTVTTRTGDKDWFRRAVPLKDLQAKLSSWLQTAISSERNLIVRPHGRDVTFIQLDDLKADRLPKLAPPVVLALETSPGNYQAWVALAEPEDKEFARRLRKGSGADPTASGATRIAGSINFKDKYAPGFPEVRIERAQAGRLTTRDELAGLGLVADPERAPVLPSPACLRPGAGKRRWPDYARCLEGAPLNSEETGPDVSKADFVWCMTAVTWGRSVDETKGRLMEESLKAQENGERYADLTARNAAAAVDRRRQAKHYPAKEHDRR